MAAIPDGAFGNRLELALLFNEGAGGMVLDYSPMGLSQIFQAAALSPAALPGPTWGKGPDGPAARFFATATANLELNYFRKGINRFANSGVPFTVMFYGKQTTAGNRSTIFTIGERADANNTITFGTDGASGAIALGNNGTADVASSSFVPTSGVPFVAGCSQTTSTARTFFFNGQTASNTTSVGTATIGANQPITVGSTYVNAVQTTTDNWAGEMYYLFIWSRALSVKDMQAIYRDPYSPFINLRLMDKSVKAPAAPVTGSSVSPQAFMHMQRMRKRSAA